MSTKGKLHIISIKKVKGEQNVQLEFVQKIQKPTTNGSSLLTTFMKGDSRFNSKPVHHWQTMTILGASQVYPELAEKLENFKGKELGYKVEFEKPYQCPPANIEGNEIELSIRIEEYTGARTDYEMENPESAAKQYVNDDGVTVYLRKEGELIFRSTSLVPGTNDDDVYVQHDSETEYVDSERIAVNPVKDEEETVTEKQEVL